MQEQEQKRVKDSAENRKSIDDDHFEDLKRQIEEADRLEACLSCNKCMSILECLRKISLDARNELVQVNPQNASEVMRLQQTAKIFDTVFLVIRNTVNMGQLALDEISPQED